MYLTLNLYRIATLGFLFLFVQTFSWSFPWNIVNPQWFQAGFGFLFLVSIVGLMISSEILNREKSDRFLI